MESILLIILIGLAGGIAVGLQSPMASMITQQLGAATRSMDVRRAFGLAVVLMGVWLTVK